MSRITSKLQVTVPKRLADEYGLVPGSEVTFVGVGGVILLRPGRSAPGGLSVEERIALFDAATARLEARLGSTPPSPRATDRGWSREELYDRAGPR